MSMLRNLRVLSGVVAPVSVAILLAGCVTPENSGSSRPVGSGSSAAASGSSGGAGSSGGTSAPRSPSSSSSSSSGSGSAILRDGDVTFTARRHDAPRGGDTLIRENTGGVFGYDSFADVVDGSPNVVMRSLARGISGPAGGTGRATFSGRYDAVVVAGRDTPRAGGSGVDARLDRRFVSGPVVVNVDLDQYTFSGSGGGLTVNGGCTPLCHGEFAFSDTEIGVVRGFLGHALGRDELNAAFHGVNSDGGVAGALRATR